MSTPPPQIEVTDTEPAEENKMGPHATFWLGAYFVVLAETLLFALLFLWVSDVPGEGGGCVGVTLFGLSPKGISAELWMIFVVIVSSALGSYVHAGTSFVDYAGNQRLGRTWIWWYILRTPIGIALALVFYFVVRGGLLSAQTSSKELNSFGVAAIAGMVGMFSKQATDKLREMFDTLFRTAGNGGDAQREDKLN